VVGLGPGDARWLTPEAGAWLAAADAVYGYGAYLDRVPVREGQARHPSDNREEGARAAAALRHAAQGAKVAIVSGGDPGVFAMAAAVCAEIEAGPDAAWRAPRPRHRSRHHRDAGGGGLGWRAAGTRFLRARSPTTSPWELVERRLDAAATTGFVIALYNPIWRARPWQLGAALDRLRIICRRRRPWCSVARSAAPTNASR
jgi:precorrin-3B C17-methyltransferase